MENCHNFFLSKYQRTVSMNFKWFFLQVEEIYNKFMSCPFNKDFGWSLEALYISNFKFQLCMLYIFCSRYFYYNSFWKFLLLHQRTCLELMPSTQASYCHLFENPSQNWSIYTCYLASKNIKYNIENIKKINMFTL